MVDDVSSTLVTTSSTTYISGLSGFDSSALIEAAVQAKLAPAYVLEARVEEDEAVLSSYSEMASLLETLEDTLNALRNEPGTLSDPSVFESRAAYLSSDDSSTPGNYLGVVVDENTEPTSYEIQIQQLATAHKISSDRQSSETDALGLDGVFSLGAGSSSADITITADMSLEDVRNAINDSSDESGVSASILQVSDTEFILVLSASETGQEISLSSVSGDDIAQKLGILNTDSSVKNELQTVQNAILSVDGVQVERSTNSIDDLIEGVSLDLYSANQDATFTLELDYSYSDVKEELLAFVDAYNAYREFALIHQDVDSSGNVSEDATLFGDDVLRGVNNSLYDSLNDTWDVDGVTYSLGSLGITFDSENALEVDETVLDAFLLDNIDVVAEMFEFQYESDDENLMVLSREGQIASGSYALDISVDGGGNITDVSVDGDNSLFEIDGNTLTGVAGSEFAGMVFVFTGTESSTVNISFSQGFADSLYNELDDYTNVVDGSLTEAQRAREERLSNATSEISSIESAAAAEEERLITYYANLEAKIAVANALSDYLDAITSSDD